MVSISVAIGITGVRPGTTVIWSTAVAVFIAVELMVHISGSNGCAIMPIIEAASASTSDLVEKSMVEFRISFSSR